MILNGKLLGYIYFTILFYQRAYFMKNKVINMIGKNKWKMRKKIMMIKIQINILMKMDMKKLDFKKMIYEINYNYFIYLTQNEINIYIIRGLET